MEVKEHVANLQRARGTYKIPPPIVINPKDYICFCDSEDTEPHCCPYKEEINGDFTLCTCCEYCEDNCKMDI